MSDLEKLQAELAELKAENETLKTAPKGKDRRIIKRNKSGGLFVRDPSFKATSKTGKPYVASVNLPADIVGPLFAPEIITAISEYLANETPEQAVQGEIEAIQRSEGRRNGGLADLVNGK